MSALSRREFIAAMMAGGVMTAAGMWWPGTKLISIPKSPRMEFISAPWPHGIAAVIYNDDGSVRRMVTVEQFYAMESDAEAIAVRGYVWGGAA